MNTLSQLMRYFPENLEHTDKQKQTREVIGPQVVPKFQSIRPHTVRMQKIRLPASFQFALAAAIEHCMSP